MVKYYCDICGKEIKDFTKVTQFKLKKRVLSWQESWWEKVLIHKDCWEDMCDYIRDRRNNDGKY